VLAHAQRHRLRVKFAGQRLKEVTDFIYLGVMIAADGVFCDVAARTRRKVGCMAMAKVRQLATRVGVTSARILCDMFDVVVLPAMSYGAEIWADKFVCAEPGTDGYKQAEELHKADAAMDVGSQRLRA
jgi:hypothetical protein